MDTFWLNLLIAIVVWGVVFSVLWWGIGRAGLAPPFAQIAVVVLVIFSILVLYDLVFDGGSWTMPRVLLSHIRR